MKTKIDKSRVEFEFFRYMKCFTHEFDNRNDELMCDYVDLLHKHIENVNDHYFDALHRNNAYHNEYERAFVVIECETQNEYIAIYDYKHNYVRVAFRVFE